MTSCAQLAGAVVVERYLEVLFGRSRASTLIDVRWRQGDEQMERAFVPVGDRARLTTVIPTLAAAHDVYVGVLPRWRHAGGRDAIAGDCRTVWLDLDLDASARALEPVEPAPSLALCSGGPGHLHAYWSLRRVEPPSVIERANRRLAWALGADPVSTDAARILRPPASVNHLRGGVAVTFAEAVELGGPCLLSDLVGGLADPPQRRADAPSRHHGRARRVSGDWLSSVPPERYVLVLTGERPNRDRKVHCPLHDDWIPSLHVYDDPEAGWYCFGCRRGGTIYDLAGALWGVQPRGDGMHALRSGLQGLLDPDVRRS